MWVKRFKIEMATSSSRPGVWKTRSGGWFVRARATNPKTGKQETIQQVLDDGDADAAFAWLRAEVARIRAGGVLPMQLSRTRFAEYAPSVQEAKIRHGRIWSPKGKDKWSSILEHHLLPRFGAMFMDAIEPHDVKAWYDEMADQVLAGKLAASTATGRLSILAQILPKQCGGLRGFQTPPGKETYTDEAPNSLTPEDVPRFLDEILASWPQHYAMTVLGLSTGLRPSSMRPLRRQGQTPDLLWDTGDLLIRRSQTIGEAVDRTKTKLKQRIPLPPDLMDILRWHIDRLTGKQAASDLLFPSESGGYRAASVLDKPFGHAAAAIGLKYTLTARAMRRTFQDLSRAAKIRDIVVRSISGHATEAMQNRYSTVSEHERRDGLAQIIDIMQVKTRKSG